MHDLTIDRTTNGSGNVRDFTLQEIKRLDAGSWHSPAFCHEQVPTLDETIATLKSTPTQLCIEIKGASLAEAQQALSRTIDVIEAHDVIDRCILSSFTPQVLTRSKQRQPQLQTALDPDSSVRFTARELCRQVDDVGGDLLLQRYNWLSRELVDEIHTYNIPIWTWTVNDEHDMRAVIDFKVEGIMTDYPARLRQLLSPPSS